MDVVQISPLCASTPVLSPSMRCLHVDMYRASATSDFQLNLASRSLGRDRKEEKAKLGYFSPWLPLHKVLHWLCPLTEGYCPSQGRMLSSSGSQYSFSLLVFMVLGVATVCISNLSIGKQFTPQTQRLAYIYMSWFLWGQ